MRTFLLILIIGTSFYSCTEVHPKINIQFVNLTGKVLNKSLTSKGSLKMLNPQDTSSVVSFIELRSGEDPVLEIKFSAEIDGQKFNQLAEFRAFDPGSYSQSPGNYIGEVRTSIINNQIQGFHIRLIKKP